MRWDLPITRSEQPCSSGAWWSASSRFIPRPKTARSIIIFATQRRFAAEAAREEARYDTADFVAA
jgi:hypothetical protein